ncbi:MAG TPA: hypothetical protein VNJ47_06125 [Nevskiales bacterium]|nr:hypothetical protein [Nevskiales bacterium]
MRRTLPAAFLGLFVLCPPAQASLLDDLRQSLLTGPVPGSVPALREPPRLEQGAETSAQDLSGERPTDPVGPGLFLMPAGSAGDPGLGIGIRLTF